MTISTPCWGIKPQSSALQVVIQQTSVNLTTDNSDSPLNSDILSRHTPLTPSVKMGSFGRSLNLDTSLRLCPNYAVSTVLVTALHRTVLCVFCLLCDKCMEQWLGCLPNLTKNSNASAISFEREIFEIDHELICSLSAPVFSITVSKVQVCFFLCISLYWHNFNRVYSADHMGIIIRDYVKIMNIPLQ